MNYFDLYLIHWPFAFESDEKGGNKCNQAGQAVLDNTVTIEETWATMEEIHAQRKAMSIGVSNFSIKMLERILKVAKIKPAVNQVEMHPYLPQDELLNFCKKNGIVVEAYSPLGTGGEPSLLNDPVIKEVASREGMTAAQCLISWGITRGTVVISKTSTPERVAENIHLCELSAESMKRIETGITIRHRFCDPVSFFQHDCFN